MAEKRAPGRVAALVARDVLAARTGRQLLGASLWWLAGGIALRARSRDATRDATLLRPLTRSHPTPRLAVRSPRRRRRAATAAKRAGARAGVTAGAATGGYTTSQIGEYQLFVWTSFFLALVVLGVVYMIAAMSMGPDTAGLFAEFKQVRDEPRAARR